MKKLRKFLTISVMVLSVIAMSGLVIAPSAKASASTGDLIKMSGLSSVYYLGADGKRYVFPNSTTYFSWYTDFSGVVTIPASELQSYPLGGNVTMRPGTKLVKITTDPSVYAVLPNGVLSKIQSEAQAAALYGTNWSKRVVDVPDAFFTNYTVGSPLTVGAIPTGSLVQTSGSASVYYYDGTNYRLVANEAALTANRFVAGNILTTTTAITASGSQITGAETNLINVAQNGGTGIVVTGSGLMVSLNSNTAASNTVVSGQALANLASFNFTAASDGSVNVTSVKLKRIGISSDSDINNIYLYNGNTKLTDNGSFGNGYVTFSASNGIFTVPAGQTVTITAKADMNGTTGNIGVAVNAASDITASASAISGSFPLNGNLMSETSATNLAHVTVGTVTPSTATTINAGTMSATVWSAPFTVTNKAVQLSYISFKQIGSISNDALANLTLYVNGVQAGSAATIDSNTRVTFDLTNSPVTLNTGSNTVELRADVVKGSSRTYSFSLQTSSDAVLMDTNYNINVAANAPDNGAQTTISNGNISLALDPTFTTNQVVKNASNVVLSRYTMKAYGEDIKVNTVTIHPVFGGTATNTEGINNLALYVNGSQVGSSQNYIMTSGSFPVDPSFGTNNLFTIQAGTTVTLEVRGDLNMLSTSNVSSVEADFQSDTYQGNFSFTTGANSATTGTTLSVVSGNLTVSQNTGFQSQYVSQNTANQLIGSYIIQAGNAEAVRVTNLNIGIGGTLTDLTKLSNLYISDNTNKVNPQSANNFPVNFTLQPNGSHEVDVYADLGTIATGTTATTSLTVTAIGNSTNVSVGGNAVGGQTVTVQSGTLSAPTLVANTPSSMLIAGGTSNVVTATYNFSSPVSAATLNEVVINVVGANGSTANAQAIKSISVGGVSAPVSCSGSVCAADITGLSIAIPAGNSGTNVAVTPTFNTVTSANQGGAATNNAVVLNLVSYKSTIGSKQTTVTSNTATSSLMVLVASVPTVALSSDNPAGQSSGFAAGGNTDVLHFTVANSNVNSPIKLKAFTVTPTFSGTLTGTTLNVYNSSDLNTVIGTGVSSTTSGTPTKITFNADQTITSTQSYVVKADTSGLNAQYNSYRLDLTSNDTYGVGTAWQWNDGTVNTYINGYLVKNLPLTGNNFIK